MCLILERIKKEEFYIYGNGTVARRLYLLLKQRDLLDTFKGFVVTKIESMDDNGVYCIDDNLMNYNRLFLLAVHDVYRNPIENELIKRGVCNYIWVYNYMFELELGKPMVYDYVVSPEEAIVLLKDKIVPAVFYAMVDEACSGGKHGRDLYVKYQSYYTTSQTAEKRADFFAEKIEKHKNGMAVNIEPVLFDEHMSQCIDGNHRLVLAFYFNIKEIKCNLYSEERCQNIMERFNTTAKMFWDSISEEERKYLRSIIKTKLVRRSSQ